MWGSCPGALVQRLQDLQVEAVQNLGQLLKEPSLSGLQSHSAQVLKALFI